VAIAIAVGAGVSWAIIAYADQAETAYRFVDITRADIESTVAATGTVQATETVEVGTQVSGQIAEILVDFNDKVQKGQLLARIDPTILEQEVRAARVNVDRNQTELDQTRRELDRVEALSASGVVTASELDDATYRNALADAAYRSAAISLERAERNLAYTEIRAPISGVVIGRAVEVGQTVAASLSAPVLFILAQDLTRMEILASIDESDIGQIAAGQPVHFGVQAYPSRTFEGQVTQVRLEAKTQENVVTYGVVIAAGNEDGVLLPGMTATVDIVLERVEDALTVPNTALRLQATDAMMAAVVENRATSTAVSRGGTRTVSVATTGAERAQASIGAAGTGTLWYVAEDGALKATRVRTGFSDGTRTVLVEAPDELVEGVQVIAAITTGPTETQAVNPFQSQQSSGPPRRAGGF
jgi:HlyD family secretion protein